VTAGQITERQRREKAEALRAEIDADTIASIERRNRRRINHKAACG